MTALVGLAGHGRAKARRHLAGHGRAKARRHLIVIALFAAAGCRQDMHDQPKYEPGEPSAFFTDGRSDRPLVANTVARGELRDDVHLYTGKVNGADAETFPFPIDARRLLRGQERYNIYCSPCHSRTGDGDGMIVRRGYRRPPSFHDDRLVKAPIGHYVDVMTIGFGAMPDYAFQVAAEDRWHIAAYIRALQLSQRATLNDVPAERRGSLGRPVADSRRPEARAPAARAERVREARARDSLEPAVGVGPHGSKEKWAPRAVRND